MTWAIPRLIAYAVVMMGSVLVIRRWQFRGFLISVSLGWLLIWLVFHIWPADGWDEDGEEWPVIGWIILCVWCFPVYLWVWTRNRGPKRV